jgi:hypothetical protein
MNPFIKRSLEDHKKELAEIKARNLPRIQEIDRERMIHKDKLQVLAKEKVRLKQDIVNKELYVKTLE